MTADLDAEEVVDAIPPKTIRFPAFEFAGNHRTYDHVTLRPLTLGDMLDAGKLPGALDQNMKLIALTSEMPPAAVRLLPPQVLEIAGRYFARFSLPSQATGET